MVVELSGIVDLAPLAGMIDRLRESPSTWMDCRAKTNLLEATAVDTLEGRLDSGEIRRSEQLKQNSTGNKLTTLVEWEIWAEEEERVNKRVKAISGTTGSGSLMVNHIDTSTGGMHPERKRRFVTFEKEEKDAETPEQQYKRGREDGREVERQERASEQQRIDEERKEKEDRLKTAQEEENTRYAASEMAKLERQAAQSQADLKATQLRQQIEANRVATISLTQHTQPHVPYAQPFQQQTGQANTLQGTQQHNQNTYAQPFQQQTGQANTQQGMQHRNQNTYQGNPNQGRNYRGKGRGGFGGRQSQGRGKGGGKGGKKNSERTCAAWAKGGHCANNNCTYRHSGELESCKIFMRTGKCRYGNACFFMHASPQSGAPALMPPQQGQGMGAAPAQSMAALTYQSGQGQRMGAAPAQSMAALTYQSGQAQGMGVAPIQAAQPLPQPYGPGQPNNGLPAQQNSQPSAAQQQQMQQAQQQLKLEPQGQPAVNGGGVQG